ncbi:hypothetical protein FRB91_010998, partial [Serendipita sp. 411]
MLAPSTIRKIIKELNQLKNEPLEDIRVQIDEEDVLQFVGIIAGPVGTPYHGGYFRVRFTFGNEFPASPPKCIFTTKIFHPNVSSAGDICVNTLKKDWKATYGIGHILTVIKCLLIYPNPESALDEQAGKMLLDDYDGYCKRAKLMTNIHATIGGRPVEFEDASKQESATNDPLSISFLDAPSSGQSLSTATSDASSSRTSTTTTQPSESPANDVVAGMVPPLRTSAQSNGAPRSSPAPNEKDAIPPSSSSTKKALSAMRESYKIPGTVSEKTGPFHHEPLVIMIDDLVRFCLAEIAYEGELGCTIDRLKELIASFSEKQVANLDPSQSSDTTAIPSSSTTDNDQREAIVKTFPTPITTVTRKRKQNVDDAYCGYVYSLIVKHPSIIIGTVPEGTPPVWIAPPPHKKEQAPPPISLNVVEFASEKTMQELKDAHGSTLRIAATKVACFVMITGTHNRPSKLTDVVYTTLQIITRARDEGVAIKDLGHLTKYDPKAIFFQISQLIGLDQSVNKTHQQANLILAAGFENPTRHQRRFFTSRVSEMVDEGLVDRFAVPTSRGNAVCLQLTQSGSEELKNSEAMSLAQQSRSPSDDHIYRADIEDEEYEWTDENRFQRQIGIQRQIVTCLENRPEGMIIKDLSASLGLFDGRTVEKVLTRLSSRVPPRHLVHLHPVVVMESIGKMRRQRYYTLKHYQAMLQKQNIPDDRYSWACMDDVGNFANFTEDMFWESPEDITTFIEAAQGSRRKTGGSNPRDLINTTRKRKYKNPIIDGVVKRGRPRKEWTQASGDTQTANAGPSSHARNRKRKSLENDGPEVDQEAVVAETHHIPSPPALRRIYIRKAQKRRRPTRNESEPDGKRRKLEGVEAPGEQIESTIRDVLPVDVNESTGGPGQDTLGNTPLGGTGSSLHPARKQKQSKPKPTNYSQLKRHQEIMDVLREKGGILQINGELSITIQSHSKILENRGVETAIKSAFLMDKKTISKDVEAMGEKGLVKVLKTVVLDPNHRVSLQQPITIFYLPEVAQDEVQEFISGIHRSYRPTTPGANTRQIGSAVPFTKLKRAVTNRKGTSTALSPDTLLVAEPRHQFLEDRQTVAQMFGFLLGKCRRAQELYLFTLRDMLSDNPSPNILSVENRIVATDYWTEDLPLGSFCAIIPAHTYIPYLEFAQSQPEILKQPLKSFDIRLRRGLKIKHAAVKARLREILVILAEIQLITPLSESPNGTVMVNNSGNHMSLEAVTMPTSKKSPLPQFWRFEEQVPTWLLSLSKFSSQIIEQVPPFHRVLPTADTNNATVFWSFLQQICDRGSNFATLQSTSTPPDNARFLISPITLACLCNLRAWTANYRLSRLQEDYLKRMIDVRTLTSPLDDPTPDRLVQASHITCAPQQVICDYFSARIENLKSGFLRLEARKK